MARFHSLKIIDINRESKEAVSISFEVPEKHQAEYQFKQGQYITLKLSIDGEEVRRSYSLCSSPFEKEVRIAVKEVAGGKVSTFINRNLKVGAMMEVMTPMGYFYSVLSGRNEKNYVLFAGGSGITPIMSIIKSILYVEKNSLITLFYANKNEESTIFKIELDALSKNNKNLKLVYVFDQPINKISDLQTGIVSSEKTLALLENFDAINADEYFICGPAIMMENVKNILEKLKIKKEKIHVEYFNAVIEALSKEENNLLSPNVKAKIKVLLYGVETNFELKTSSISILEAAIEAGVDAPFSCKGAVCCTCRAKVLDGKVKMDANFALTEAEVEEGFILTCQAHPISENVTIDYDS